MVSRRKPSLRHGICRNTNFLVWRREDSVRNFVSVRLELSP